jgi:hypothetical protein
MILNYIKRSTMSSNSGPGGALQPAGQFEPQMGTSDQL